MLFYGCMSPTRDGSTGSTEGASPSRRRGIGPTDVPEPQDAPGAVEVASLLSVERNGMDGGIAWVQWGGLVLLYDGASAPNEITFIHYPSDRPSSPSTPVRVPTMLQSRLPTDRSATFTKHSTTSDGAPMWPRTGFTATVVENVLIVWGGKYVVGESAPMDATDTPEWDVGPATPIGRFPPHVGNHGRLCDTALHVLDLLSLQWFHFDPIGDVFSIPQPRLYHAAAYQADGQKLWLYGGTQESVQVEEFQQAVSDGLFHVHSICLRPILGASDGSDASPPSGKRNGNSSGKDEVLRWEAPYQGGPLVFRHSMVIFSNFLVVFGGLACRMDVGAAYDVPVAELSNHVSLFQLEQGAWVYTVDLSPTPSPRFGSACVVVGAELYIMGGYAFGRTGDTEVPKGDSKKSSVATKSVPPPTSALWGSPSLGTYQTAKARQQQLERNEQQAAAMRGYVKPYYDRLLPSDGPVPLFSPDTSTLVGSPRAASILRKAESPTTLCDLWKWDFIAPSWQKCEVPVVAAMRSGFVGMLLLDPSQVQAKSPSPARSDPITPPSMTKARLSGGRPVLSQTLTVTFDWKSYFMLDLSMKALGWRSTRWLHPLPSVLKLPPPSASKAAGYPTRPTPRPVTASIGSVSSPSVVAVTPSRGQSQLLVGGGTRMAAMQEPEASPPQVVPPARRMEDAAPFVPSHTSIDRQGRSATWQPGSPNAEISTPVAVLPAAPRGDGSQRLSHPWAAAMDITPPVPVPEDHTYLDGGDVEDATALLPSMRRARARTAIL